MLAAGTATARDVTGIVIERTLLDERIAEACRTYCQGNRRKGQLRRVEVLPVAADVATVRIDATLRNRHVTGPVLGFAGGVLYDHAIEVVATGRLHVPTCMLKVETIEVRNDVYGLGELARAEQGKVHHVENCREFL